MPYYTSFALVVLASVPLAASDDWPDYRGPNGDGTSGAADLPLVWSENEHVLWKTPIPGRGWSTPVICEDRLWMTTATPDGHELFVVCVDKHSGKIIHYLKLFEVDRPQPIDATNSYASPSPVIEPGRVYVHFGTYGTACLDATSGRVVWSRRDFPVDHQKGPGSSPILFGELLIFQCDGNDVQYLVALDKTTGTTVWKTHRSIDLSGRDPDFRKSFSTPLVIDVDGRPSLVSTAAGGVFAFDPRNGEERWKVRYAGHTNVSRPVAGRGMVFINTGYPRAQLWAVPLNRSGDLTETHVVWKVTRNVPLIPSVLLVDDRIYMISDLGGIVTCLEADTGRAIWVERLGGNYRASPVLAGGYVYFASQEGKTTVIRPGPRYDRSAVNHLDAGCLASPAVSTGAFYWRTTTHLYRIEN